MPGSLEDRPSLSGSEATNAWVQGFLRGEGGNIKLADTLLRYCEYACGPVDYPLDQAVGIIGPTKEYKFFEEETSFNARINEMVASIENGWKPAPLILTNIWEDYMEIADGGHRHRALLRAGYQRYSAILYFRDEASKEKYRNESRLGL